MTTYLADSSLLIALTVRGHVHHERAVAWFEAAEPDIATCPITQGALLRFLVREGHDAGSAIEVLDAFRANSWHHFWSDDIEFAAPMLTGLVGHRQVTDAYLVALVSHHGGSLATLDRGMAARDPEVTLLGD